MSTTHRYWVGKSLFHTLHTCTGVVRPHFPPSSEHTFLSPVYRQYQSHTPPSKKTFEYNLRFRDSATCEDIIANKQYDLPHALISVQGSEFESEFQEFLTKNCKKVILPNLILKL